FHGGPMLVSGPAGDTSIAPLQAFVLDDDPEYGEIIADLLSFVSDGLKKWTTTSPEVARRRFERHPYDLCVVSREPGNERLLLDLRRYQPDAVVVVTSRAHLTAREISEQFAAGADEVVQKPFHPSEFVSRVNRLVQMRVRLNPMIATAS